MTWYASTPTTPVPSWSTGSIEAAAACASSLVAPFSRSRWKESLAASPLRRERGDLRWDQRFEHRFDPAPHPCRLLHPLREASSSGIGNSATPARVSYSAGWALAVAVIGGFGAGGVAGY